MLLFLCGLVIFFNYFSLVVINLFSLFIGNAAKKFVKRTLGNNSYFRTRTAKKLFPDEFPTDRSN